MRAPEGMRRIETGAGMMISFVDDKALPAEQFRSLVGKNAPAGVGRR